MLLNSRDVCLIALKRELKIKIRNSSVTRTRFIFTEWQVRVVVGGGGDLIAIFLNMSWFWHDYDKASKSALFLIARLEKRTLGWPQWSQRNQESRPPATHPLPTTTKKNDELWKRKLAEGGAPQQTQLQQNFLLNHVLRGSPSHSLGSET